MDNWQYESLQSLPPEALAANSWLTNKLRNCVYVWVCFWLKKQFSFTVEGDEIFESTSQFVLVANHSSHLDTISLLAILPSKLRNHCYSAAAEDHFYSNVFKEKIARLFGNTFPFRRREDATRSLEACARILERGDCLIFFPEGTRSKTGEVQKFRKGIGKLLQGKSFPVVPIYIKGAYEALAKGRFCPKKTHINILIGSPLVFKDNTLDELSAIEIANRLESEVRRLGGIPPLR